MRRPLQEGLCSFTDLNCKSILMENLTLMQIHVNGLLFTDPVGDRNAALSESGCRSGMEKIT